MNGTTFKQKMGTYIKTSLPWILVYAVVLGGVAAFALTSYHRYEERHLPPGSIELTVGKTNYELGEPITFTVTNHFPVAIYVTNGCPREPLSVYRWADDHWTELHATAESDAECYGEERNVAIPSEGSRSYNFDDWPNLFSEPGVYRIATAIDHSSDIPFQDFVIMEAPEVIEVEDIPSVSASPEQQIEQTTAAEETVVQPATQIYVDEDDDHERYEYEEEEYEDD